MEQIQRVTGGFYGAVTTQSVHVTASINFQFINKLTPLCIVCNLATLYRQTIAHTAHSDSGRGNLHLPFLAGQNAGNNVFIDGTYQANIIIKQCPE